MKKTILIIFSIFLLYSCGNEKIEKNNISNEVKKEYKILAL